MKKHVFSVLVLCAMIFNINVASGEENMIAEGKTVKFNYVLTVEGKVVDTSEGRGPLEYTQGKNMIIPGLEKEMVGLKVGDKKTVKVSPEEGYGLVNKEAIIEVPKTQIGPDVDPKVGMQLQMAAPSGQVASATIVEVKDAAVVLDMNHPLAGKELNFDVEIVEVK